jgi:hypothetical protein
MSSDEVKRVDDEARSAHVAERLAGRLIASWALVQSMRARPARAAPLPEPDPKATDASPAPPSTVTPKAAPWWPTLLASTAGLSAYLALLGGALLAIRFWHAGLPVTQAVGEVPVSTLITTALVEVAAPLLPLFGVSLFTVLPALVVERSQGPARPQRNETSWDRFWRRFVKPAAALLVAGILPLNLWGGVFFLSLLVVLFPEVWLRSLATPRISTARAVGIYLAVVLGASSLPVLARQYVDPLNMERVRIARLGQPELLADLVAVRDTSIAVARCHHLLVLPLPAKIRIEGLPRNWSTAHSIFDRLGIKADAKLAKRPMPC